MSYGLSPREKAHLETCAWCKIGWPVFKRSRRELPKTQVGQEWMAMTEERRMLESQKAARAERKTVRRQAPNAYQLFLSARLDRTKPMTEQMQALAKAWRELPAELKEPFERQSAKRKRERTLTMAKIGVKPKKKPKLANINGFYVFMREHMGCNGDSAFKNDTKPLPALLKELSPKWRALSAEVKQMYKQRAIDLKASSTACASIEPSLPH
jgi:hypothetical protein